ncbi:hypothetical protein C5E45_29160 [Nocardia nova]|uniref:Ig-like domain repeat protein n=2 Tax=Nocardia nova TaxID=37330 RepID=A0A2S6AHN2_9NOCA|nr:hypothetical protein C5E41_25290 [Nocardia nova]PPJ34724.1 hypothetical protein C5E45_29160 [Nocardia nova]
MRRCRGGSRTPDGLGSRRGAYDEDGIMHETTISGPPRQRVRRRAATVVSGGILGAAAVFAAAFPQTANAAVTRLGATPDMNFGIATDYGSGCSYTLQANVTDPVAPVTFYDNGVPIGVTPPGGAYALITWVPAVPGQHTLSAVQAGRPAQMPSATLDLPVGTGIRLGYACLVAGG